MSVKDTTAIFTMEFQVVGQPGGSSGLTLTDTPTRRRVVVGTSYGQFVSDEDRIRVETSEPLVRITLVREGFPPQIKVLVPTTEGRSYFLEQTDQLTEAPAWSVMTEIRGDGTLQTVLLPAERERERFYRVRVR